MRMEFGTVGLMRHEDGFVLFVIGGEPFWFGGVIGCGGRR